MTVPEPAAEQPFVSKLKRALLRSMSGTEWRSCPRVLMLAGQLTPKTAENLLIWNSLKALVDAGLVGKSGPPANRMFLLTPAGLDFLRADPPLPQVDRRWCRICGKRHYTGHHPSCPRWRPGRRVLWESA